MSCSALALSRRTASGSNSRVGADYFATLSEPMLAGREFDERDQRSQADGSKTFSLPVVLNETAERRLFGNENAIGKHVGDDKQSYETGFLSQKDRRTLTS
jgi:hypothetical protein